MKVAGFPTTIGSFSVDPHIAATIHPAPEKRRQRIINISIAESYGDSSVRSY